jgi:hypothetical protein
MYDRCLSFAHIIQNIAGKTVNILGGHNIDRSKQKKKKSVHVISRTVSGIKVMDVIARIKERHDALRPATHHFLTRVTKCVDINLNFRKCIVWCFLGNATVISWFWIWQLPLF